MTSQFTCPDIHCEKCARRVREALTGQPGVRQVQVDVPAQRVEIDYDDALTSAAALGEILASAGYKAR
jgi:copper chaperone CopZ